MENSNAKTNTFSHSTTTSGNYFLEWIVSNYLPNLLVYSSESAKKIISKNNLSPSEFLRPFGNFSGTNVNFSYGDRFTINLKNLKFDLYDNEKFAKYYFNNMSSVAEILMTSPQNYPEWNLNLLSKTSKFSKLNSDPIIRRLKSFSFPWYTEYEKAFLEASHFNEYEIFQQPFANIFLISIKDDKREIEFFQNRKNIPLLLEEGIYEKNIPSMILMLNDKSNPNENFSYDAIFKSLESIRSAYPNHYVLCCDINSNNIDSGDGMPPQSNDIWSKYFHKLDYYKSDNSNYKDSNIKYGEYISLEERDNFKSAIIKFFNDYIKVYLQKLVLDLDDEITNNKKGIKNGFLSIFKKGEKIEYVNVFNVYKLTPMEKKLYLLSLIQFYFRDYENAMEHLKILMGDIKSKSLEHFNSILELFTICHFICSPGAKKDVDFEGPYNSYIKSKNTKGAMRYLFLYVKMFEHLKRFSEIPKLLIRGTSDLNAPLISPLLLEKSSIYYLLQNPQIKKFIFFQVLAGLSYKNQSADLKRYSLNCFGNVIKFFSISSPSFLRTKEFLNSSMGDICMNCEYFEGAFKFFKNCIETSTFKNIEQDQALYIRHFLKNLNSLGKGTGLSYIEIEELNIPEIVNSSLLVIEEQDYDIGVKAIIDMSVNQDASKNVNWGNFMKYTKVDINKSYINLSENDGMTLKNLDNIIENKQNFSNFHSKRNFKANVGSKIYVRFLIRNPLNLNLSISSLKLLCDFNPDKSPIVSADSNDNNSNTTTNDKNDNIAIEEKSLLLEKNSSSIVTLSCVPKAPGRIVIQGLEVGLYKIALFKHSFYKKSVSELHNYRERSKSVSSQNSKESKESNEILIKQIGKSNNNNNNNNNNTTKNNTKEICFDIIDDKQDIKVIFPKGKEINIYNNEIMLMPILIKNNANFKIKRFCLFFDDSEIVITKNSNLKYENNVCLADTIFNDVDLPKDSQHEVIKLFLIYLFKIIVPICPQKAGEYYLKIIIKFEEESRFREIDVKRFIIKFNVKPSVKFNISEDILFYESHKTNFNLDVNTYIENRRELSSSSIKIDQIYFNYNYQLVNSNSGNDWRMLENENYNKIYTKLKFRKIKIIPENISKLNSSAKKHKINATYEINNKDNDQSNDSEINSSFSSFSSATSGSKIYIHDKFEFLPSEIYSNQPHIITCLNKILSQDKILFNWTAKNQDNEIINGVSIYECVLKSPTINKTFLKTVFKNSILFEVIQNVIGDNVLVTLILNLNKKNIEVIPEIAYYEIYINDEEYEFTWMGTSRYKIVNSGSTVNKGQPVAEFEGEESNNKMKFNFMTNKKGIIEISKINMTVQFRNIAEKPIVISNIPNTIIIEVV